MFKLKKDKMNLYINVCFFLYLLIKVILCFRNIYINEYSHLSDELQYHNFSEIIMMFSLMFLISLFSTLFNNLFLVILFIAMKVGLKKVRKEKLSYIDFKNYKGYYRDIINNYSAAVLSYIDDFKINDKDIVATLLELKLKDYINIKDGKIEILNNDYSKLNKIELYLINNLENYNIIIFEKLVMEESKMCGLLQEKNDIYNKIKKIIIKSASTFIFLSLSIFIFSYTSANIDMNSTIGMLIVIILLGLIILSVLYPMFSITASVSYLIGSLNSPYVRTKKGEEVNKMLEGLKNYLNDFSILDKRKQEEIVIWNEYLVYSVLFGQNKNIMKDFKLH